mgnify:CR=1 FL=1
MNDETTTPQRSAILDELEELKTEEVEIERIIDAMLKKSVRGKDLEGVDRVVNLVRELNDNRAEYRRLWRACVGYEDPIVEDVNQPNDDAPKEVQQAWEYVVEAVQNYQETLEAFR